MEEVECIKFNAATQYYIKGTLITHRDDGPAVIYADGDKEWYQYGKLHREGGPAVDAHLFQGWYQHGVLHREDGPAAIYSQVRSPLLNPGMMEKSYWYFQGKKIQCSSLQEFQKMIKLLAFV